MNYFNVLVWPGGGAIGLVIWGLSLVTLAVIIELCLAVRRRNIVPEGLLRRVRESCAAGQYRAAIEMTGKDRSFLAGVIHAALREAPHGYQAMERAMEEAGEIHATRILRRVEWLNLIGNISPMMGLLGTVWGMLLAFLTICNLAAAGSQVDVGKLAGAIGIKLVCTLLGLCVAIPSLAVYGVLRNRADALTSEAMAAAQELLAAFKPAPHGLGNFESAPRSKTHGQTMDLQPVDARG